MILQQHACYGCSYGQLRHREILQKTVQLTTFCVNSKKVEMYFFKKICIHCMVDIKISYCPTYVNKEF